MATLKAKGVKGYKHAARQVLPPPPLLGPPLSPPLLSPPYPKKTDPPLTHPPPQLRASDFQEFDYIFAMDSSNLRDTKRKQQLKAPDGKAKVLLFGEYSGGKVEEIEDPYYDGQEGFEKAYEQAVRFSRGFLEEVREKGGLKN